jgi:hypothetical protein
VKRILQGLGPLSIPAADEGLENRVRCLVFRLRRPDYFERLRYGLDRNGDPDWKRQPWRSLPDYREQWEAMVRRNSACGPRPTSSPTGTSRHDAGLVPDPDAGATQAPPPASSLRGILSRLGSGFLKLLNPSRHHLASGGPGRRSEVRP